MLSEEEKEVIKDEEWYRYQIRNSFEKKEKKTVKTNLWVFLNSAFGLWLLSTVIIGMIVNLYSNFNTRSIQTAVKDEAIRKLETEISYRVQYFKIRLEDSQKLYNFNTMNSGIQPLRRVTVKELLEETENAAHVFTEYRDRTLLSLIFELEQLKESKKDKDFLRQTRSLLKKLMLMDTGHDPSAIRKYLTDILQSLNKDYYFNKWENN